MEKNSGELQFVNIEADDHLQEFVRTERRKPTRFEPQKAQWNYGAIAGLLVLIAAVILVAVCGIRWQEVPVITVILVILLEGALAVCLRQAPIWLHAVAVAVNIVLGAVFGRLIFMVLANLVYLAGIVLAHFLNQS